MTLFSWPTNVMPEFYSLPFFFFFSFFCMDSFLYLSIYIHSSRTSRMSLTLVVYDYLLFSVLFFKKTDVIFYPPFFSFLVPTQITNWLRYMLFLSFLLIWIYKKKKNNIFFIPFITTMYRRVEIKATKK